MPSPSRIALLSGVLGLAACVGPLFFTDGTSVSVGTFTRGALRRGARLPPRGDGYVIPALWAARDSSYGTDELVRAIAQAARRVRREYPPGLLSVADLAIAGGGDSVLHRSHENGRDADLVYYAVGSDGKPAPPVDSMPRYSAVTLAARDPGPQEHGVVFGPFSPRSFDIPRNWALARALMTAPGIEIQYLFVNNGLKERMLTYAEALGEDPALLDEARELLHQPGDSLPHDDHMHVRIYCAADDRPLGCSDKGPLRWWKKRYKYLPPRNATQDLVDLLSQLRPSLGLWQRWE